MGTTILSKLSGKILAMVVIMMAILIDTSTNGVTGTTSPPNINGTSTIAYQDVDLEFVMDSETSRRFLQTSINFQTARTSDPDKAALCGRGRYRSCTGSASPGPIKDTCSTYKRNCPINR